MNRRRMSLIGTALAVGLTLGAAPAPGMESFSSPPAAKARDTRLIDAEKAVKAQDWNRAIALLDRVVADNPRDADAYNYLGYSHRKLGNRDQAFVHYTRALEIDPNHRGALEYLGELYLDMNDLPKAEEMLGRLSRVCGPRCAEYRELRDGIERFRGGQPQS